MINSPLTSYKGFYILILNIALILGSGNINAASVAMDNIKASESLLEWEVNLADNGKDLVFTTSKDIELNNLMKRKNFNEILKKGYKFSDDKYQCFFELDQGSRSRGVGENLRIECKVENSWVSTVVSCFPDKGALKTDSFGFYKSDILNIGLHRGEYLEYPEKAKKYRILSGCKKPKIEIKKKSARKELRRVKVSNDKECNLSCHKDKSCLGWRMQSFEENCLLLTR
ncbi:hypothetical protein BVX98_05890 [bacterium F11]|nr:hypothetical protein BVX98_05890 [bacterium F11]